MKQCTEIEERCKGYRAEIAEVIADILKYERDHRVAATSIQKKINEKCNATARLLVPHLHRTDDTEELDS